MSTHFATGHKNGDVKLWSLTEAKEVNKAAHLHSSQVTCLKFVPNGFNIVTASRTNGVLVIEEKSM